MSKPRYTVSDYALLQFLDVVWELDVEEVRRQILRETQTRAPDRLGMASFRDGNADFVLSGGTVVAVRGTRTK